MYTPQYIDRAHVEHFIMQLIICRGYDRCGRLRCVCKWCVSHLLVFRYAFGLGNFTFRKAVQSMEPAPSTVTIPRPVVRLKLRPRQPYQREVFTTQQAQPVHGRPLRMPWPRV